LYLDLDLHRHLHLYLSLCLYMYLSSIHSIYCEFLILILIVFSTIYMNFIKYH
jgi:hypothetical protein